MDIYIIVLLLYLFYDDDVIYIYLVNLTKNDGVLELLSNTYLNILGGIIKRTSLKMFTKLNVNITLHYIV